MSQVVSFTGYTPAVRYDDIAWTLVRIDEAAAPSGPWALIDTLTLDPVDSDPTDPRTRNLTTENASDEPDLWYRLTFEDENGDTGQPSTPVQNASAAIPVAPFATATDFAVRLGQTLTADELTRAASLLSIASGLIQDEAKQTISLVEDDVLTMRGTTDERIRLPQRPVVSVASVTLDGVELSGRAWILDGNELVRLGLTAFMFNGEIPGGFARGFGFEWQTLEIVYTHGYETVPEFVKAICLEMVNRVWVNPGSVIQEQIGDTNTTYAPYAAPPRGLLLTDAEREAIRRKFGRRAVSVTIGG